MNRKPTHDWWPSVPRETPIQEAKHVTIEADLVIRLAAIRTQVRDKVAEEMVADDGLDWFDMSLEDQNEYLTSATRRIEEDIETRATKLAYADGWEQAEWRNPKSPVNREKYRTQALEEQLVYWEKELAK